MRLIDADKLINAIKKTMEALGDDGQKRYGVETRGILQLFVDALTHAPTVDAEPTKHGEWIERTDWIGIIGQNTAKCSRCGFEKLGKPFTRGDGKGSKYCEECGAKMKRKDAEK